MKISVVIVSFNGGETLQKLISDLLGQKSKFKNIELEIVVVDNGSNENIKYQISNIKLIRNGKNLGFAKGVNIGIKYALKNGADRILLLNQDVEIEEDFLEKLIDNCADIVSPVIKFRRNGKWIYDYGGKVNWLIGRTYHIESDNQQPARRSARRQDGQGGSTINNQPLDYVSGCCLLVKKEVFEKIGFFDERFFLYFEDVDFCLRAKKAECSITVERKVTLLHKLIEGKNKTIFAKRHFLASNYLFIRKYLGIRQFFGYIYLLLLSAKIML